MSRLRDLSKIVKVGVRMVGWGFAALLGLYLLVCVAGLIFSAIGPITFTDVWHWVRDCMTGILVIYCLILFGRGVEACERACVLLEMLGASSQQIENRLGELTEEVKDSAARSRTAQVSFFD